MSFWTNRTERCVSAYLPTVGMAENNRVSVSLLYRTGEGYALRVSPANNRAGIVTVELTRAVVTGVIEHAARYSSKRFARLADLIEYEISHKCGEGWTHVARVLAATGMTLEED